MPISLAAALPKPLPRKNFEPERRRGVAPFEFAANAYALGDPSGTCAGGGATAALRVSSQWQMVVDVNGCKMTGLQKNLSGDSLSYMAGPRWTPPVTGQLVPYFQVLFGGNKLTQELVFPQQESYLDRPRQKSPARSLPIAASTRKSSNMTASHLPPAWGWISTSTAR